MITAAARPGRGRFSVGLAVGIVIGAVLTGAATVAVHRYRDARQWIDAGAVWVRLPSQIEAGPMPQTFAIPAKAYDYGAETRALEPVVTEGPAFLRVQLGEVKGQVGLSLAKPDGSALISRERPLTAKDSGKTAYFHVTGREGLVAILVRNYAAEGRPGAVTIKGVAFIPQSAASKVQLGQISAGVD
jgi:hypothetical protein